MCFIFFNWLGWNVFLNQMLSSKVVWCQYQDFFLWSVAENTEAKYVLSERHVDGFRG